MTLRPFNSVGGFSIGTIPNTIIQSNGDITTNNLTTSGLVTLGNIANVKITGGSSGQAIVTDGLGNLIFAPVGGTGSIANGTSGITITNNGPITFTVAGNTAGVYSTGGVDVTGNVVVSGQLVSTVATGTAPISVTSTTLVSNLNADLLDGFNTSVSATANTIPVRDANGNIAANFFVGNGSQLTGIITSVSNVSNGSSNLNIGTSGGPVTIGVGGTPNVAVINTTGATITGTLSVSGNANVGNIGATNGVFTNISGNGNALSSIQGGNVVGTVPSATIAGTVTTAAQPNITSVGTLTSLSVTGNISAGNVAATGITAATLGGTLTTNAQPNITSVGTLTGLTSSGNIQANGNIVTDSIRGRTIGVTITATGTNSNITLVPTGTGSINVSNARITNLATPTQDTDAASKAYVDNLAQGIVARTAADARSSTNLVATYDNGTAGVGATLTSTTNVTFPTIDGVTINTADRRRVLVTGQTNPAHNGLYVLIQQGSGSQPWILRRCSECNTAQNIPGSYVFVSGGSTSANTGWVATVANPATFTVGTDAITWIQFSGAGTFTAGTGLTLTGTTFNITNTAVTAGSYGNGDRVASFTVNQQGQLTAASTTVITANAANLTGATLSSSVVNSSLTSVGTLSTLNVSGTASVGTLSATTSNVTNTNVTGNLTIGNATVTTRVSYASTTTTSTASNQVIATFPVTGITGVEFLVKSIDSSSNRHGVATVLAVTNGTTVDFTTYGSVTLGGFTGTLTVDILSSNMRLLVTPASSNSTLWTTQYRFI